MPYKGYHGPVPSRSNPILLPVPARTCRTCCKVFVSDGALTGHEMICGIKITHCTKCHKKYYGAYKAHATFCTNSVPVANGKELLCSSDKAEKKGQSGADSGPSTDASTNQRNKRPLVEISSSDSEPDILESSMASNKKRTKQNPASKGRFTACGICKRRFTDSKKLTKHLITHMKTCSVRVSKLK